MHMILRPACLVDGTGSALARDQVVIVVEGRIQDIVPASELAEPAGAEVIDLEGCTLIPALINAHVHLVMPGDNSPFEPIQLESDVALALRAAHNAAVSLKAGAGTVRDCGGRGATVLELADALSRGMLPGARVISCGWPLTITGGHGRYFGGEADGEQQLRQMIRRLVSQGASFIKVLASGGGTPGSLSQYPSFTLEEMQAIVDAAHALGLPVAAHCIATESISLAVQAGVDTIEHGSFLEADGSRRFNARVAEQLAESQIPVVTTMQVARDMHDLGGDNVDVARWTRMLTEDREIKAKLHELGVPLIAGTDAGWRATRFDTLWKELEELVGIGMSPVEAIHAATGAAAQALNIDDRLGTIQKGRIADLIAIEGEPTSDIRCLEKVRAIFQAGSRVF
jgi:imidazolonepropionase-like amidohydrolase